MLKRILFTVAFVAMASSAALAGEGGSGSAMVLTAIMIGAGIGMGLGALGTGIGMGNAIQGATEGIARNPNASGKIMTAMIIGLAMIESLAIYTLVIALILLFANPYSAAFFG
ncbi:ATP synthase F0 subunit C [Desulfurispirillum indicum]|uniref:ATP synthase subunit c n=2 Tax=Desulfurispirillum TaxID=393029 RepID=E6W1W9_DESIS|nr:ATP synthase F0 subunit C [Desulfurispirillum indicum]ADU65501.1 ATP synthase F0, C subunit [Desulfurispirillum indicum S5]UCZ57421.1 ATP synthase F0 subunit C [Desulfurispirillum indicum]